MDVTFEPFYFYSTRSIYSWNVIWMRAKVNINDFARAWYFKRFQTDIFFAVSRNNKVLKVARADDVNQISTSRIDNNKNGLKKLDNKLSFMKHVQLIFNHSMKKSIALHELRKSLPVLDLCISFFHVFAVSINHFGSTSAYFFTKVNIYIFNIS